MFTCFIHSPKQAPPLMEGNQEAIIDPEKGQIMEADPPIPAPESYQTNTQDSFAIHYSCTAGVSYPRQASKE